jgi:hypothetical protein
LLGLIYDENRIDQQDHSRMWFFAIHSANILNILLIITESSNAYITLVKNRFFGNGGTNLNILHVKDTCGHFKTGLIMIFDPQNMGLETIFFQLSVILAEIWWITDLPIMAA